MQKTLRIKNDIHELSMMNQFLEEAGEELGLSTAFMMSLNLVMEEAVSNIIFYAYKGDVEDAVDISLVRFLQLGRDICSKAPSRIHFVIFFS